MQYVLLRNVGNLYMQYMLYEQHVIETTCLNKINWLIRIPKNMYWLIILPKDHVQVTDISDYMHWLIIMPKQPVHVVSVQYY